MRIPGVTAALDLVALAWIREISQNSMQACVLPGKSYEEQALSMTIDAHVASQLICAWAVQAKTATRYAFSKEG
jgi:hypothetical protein